MFSYFALILNLVIDIGNTRAKLALFSNGRILDARTVHELNRASLTDFLGNRVLTNGIISSVGREPDLDIELIRLHHSLKLPFIMGYTTPETLGHDRIANVAGAVTQFPETNCLVVDAGTCLTFDWITSDGLYRGGSISPGLHMRARALNTFTTKLPLIDPKPDTTLIGNSTTTSMNVGVFKGMCNEIDGMIQEYQRDTGTLKVILTGGDMPVFENALKSSIFADSQITLTGLNAILDLNAK